MTTKTIPLPRFADYVTIAKSIQRTVGVNAPDGVDLHKAVADLADLAVKALQEAQQTYEGLAMVVMALHPEIGRTHRQRKA